MEIFKLFGSIFVNTDAAEKSMKSIGKTMEEIGDKISSFGGKLTKTVTAGIVALGTAAVVSASGFEDAMAKVSTIADESEMSMEDMEQAILDLSNQTGVSATAIAEDVYNAISAGQKTADAVNFVSNSTKLAKAGFAETSQSLDILTTIMNAYGLEAKDVTRVSDVLIQTQNLGKTTVADLSSTMGKVIPTAKSYNVSLEQLASAYTITTAKGIATAESTTYINSMLNELGKSGTTVAGTLKEKTGKSFAELMGEGYSLGDCLEIVDAAAKEQNLAFNDMWGSAEAAKAGITLLGESASVFNSRLAEMNDVTGSTDTAFGKLETTSFKVQKAVNEAKNVLVDLGGTVLEMLVPYLEKGAQKVHEFADWFKGLDDNAKETIVKIGLLVAAVGPLLTIFGKGISVVGNVITIGGKLFSGIGSIVKLIGTLVPAIGAIGAPVLIVIGVITALIAVGVLLYKNWDTIKEWAGNVWGAIKDIVSGAVEKIKGFFTAIIDFVKNNWQGLLLLLVNPFVGGFKLLYDNCEQFRNFIDGFLEKIKGLISTAVEKIKGFFTGIIDFVKNNWQGLLLLLVNPFVGGFKLLYDNCEQFRNFIDGFLGKIKEGFQNFCSGISEKASDLKAGVLERFSKLGDGIREKLDSVKNFAKDCVDKLKAFFNFDWQLPKIKLPHFSMEGSFSLTPPSIPHISVEWYKKAMDNPLLMEKPTAFGISPDGRIMAGGEAGSEVVSGTETLMGMIKAAVMEAAWENNSAMGETLGRIYDLLAEYLPKLAKMQIVLDTGAVVGELTVPMNEALGWLTHARGRRN